VAPKQSAAAKKRSTGKKGTTAPKKRWVKRVTTDSTHPPKDLFTKSAPVIARSLASKTISPKGPGSGMRMLTYFINRAGKGLSASRRRTLERAKELLHERIEKEKQKKAA
jgi:tRNA(adenine34) deaminase